MELDREQCVAVLHHGAGYSALTFAPFAKDLKRLLSHDQRTPPNVSFAIIAVDARLHGMQCMGALGWHAYLANSDGFIRTPACSRWLLHGTR